MIVWILKNFKMFITLVTMVIIPAIVGVYTFVTIVLTSEGVNAEQSKKIIMLEQGFSEVKSQSATNNAILKEIREDTAKTREILYKEALRRGR
jgi:hypothetical protein